MSVGMNEQVLAEPVVTTTRFRPSRGRIKIPAGLSAFLHNGKAVFGLSLFSFICMLSILAPFIANANPNANDYIRHLSPRPHHLFGTTDYAQDIFSQIV